MVEALTADELRRQLTYDPDAGVFRWLVHKRKASEAYKAAALLHFGEFARAA